MMDEYFIGVDVGSSSVRAGLVTSNGRLVEQHSHEISIHSPKPEYFQQSSNEIWQAVIVCIKKITQNIDKKAIKGIGFDATCSLVVIGDSFQGLSIDPDNSESQWDIIMWMDHRALNEAKFINNLGHSVLDFVGKTISPEMQTPKMLWIKKNLPNIWSKTKYFMDLSDFLVWKATRSLTRSLCSTVCKWTYEVGLDKTIKGWNESYFQQIGLQDFVENHFHHLGTNIVSPGTFVGYLSEKSAEEMDLQNSCISIGASLIDAHAGALGMIACAPAREMAPPEEQLGLICGTSTCHMFLSKSPLLVSGVWGPYYSAVLPNYWLNEGGQTAVGSLIDHVLKSHAAFNTASQNAKKINVPIQQYLEKILQDEANNLSMDNISLLTKNYHIWPDYHGNRAPLADPEMKGMICGLTLDDSEHNLAICYLAAIQAVAYGTKHIVDQLKSKGSKVNVVTICGGLSNSNHFVQIHADVLGITIIKPQQKESVLLGSAMLGAYAHFSNKDNFTFNDIIKNMQNQGTIFQPNLKIQNFHDKKYKVFLQMGQDQLKYRDLMNNV